ncbi:MAG: hypothetical protein IPH75_12820 [bacterium]|nr:hypothetical protein [bacterium]
MRSLATAFALIAAGGAIWFTVYSIRMCDYLQKHGRKVNFLLLRLYLPKYISEYKEMTTAESGQPGNLYGRALIGINVTLVTAVLAIVVRLLS